MNRGDVYAHPKFTHRQFAVISTDVMAETGVVVVAEIRDSAPSGPWGMVAVPLSSDDPGPGGVVRADRINYLATTSLGDRVGRLTPRTVALLDMALRAALDLD